MGERQKFYLSFGHGHAHAVGGFTYDKDVLCEIEAYSEMGAREQALAAFGHKWSMMYHAYELPELRQYFPRGIHQLSPVEA